VREQAEKAKTETREAVELVEQTREPRVKEDVMWAAMERLHAAIIHDAEARSAMLEDWYLRTYSLISGKEGA